MEKILFDEVMLSRLMLHMLIGLIMCIMVTIAIFVDLWDGVYTAKKCGKRIHSHKLRVTGEKVGEYFRFIFILFLVDTVGVLFPWYALPYLTLLISIGLIGVEVKSMFEHAKERKSNVIKAKDVIELIVRAKSEGDAKKALERVREYLDDTDKKA